METLIIWEILQSNVAEETATGLYVVASAPMKTIARLILILCAANPAFAILNTAKDSGGFFTPENLPVRPANLERAVQATPFLKTDVEYGANCSSVLLSNDGYVATNIHCLKLCLNKVWGLYDPQIEQIEIKKEGFYNGTRFPEAVPSRLECPRYAMSALELEKYGLKNPKVVWMGKGRHTHYQEKVVRLSEEEFRSFSDLTEDVVILKYENSQRVPCLPVNRDEVGESEKVWLLGFPSDTKRGSKFGRLSVSYGNVRASVRQDPIYQSQVSNVSEELRDLFWQREAAVWDQPHLLTTSLDGYSGSSGGPIIDEKGELVGIAFAMSAVSSTEYKSASLYGVKASHLLRKLSADLGSAHAAEVFRCDDEGL